MNVKMISKAISLMVALVVLSVGCNLTGSSGSTETGTLNLSITDAPIDDADVIGVWITIQSVQYNLGDQWDTMEGFDGPRAFNLLELTNGESALLGALQLPAGEYTQIRFILDAPDEGQGPPSNPGSYVEYSDDSGEPDVPLFVPSGAQTGYKVVSEEPFTVPENGEVDITVDFDLRKAIVVAGSRMLLKPTLRLVVEDQTGTISGSVTHDTLSEGHSLVVFAYETGEYDGSEPESGDNGFDNAVTSANVSDGSYTLAFLPAGTYDVVVAEFDANGEFVVGEAVLAEEGVVVEAGEGITVNLDLTAE